MITLLEMNSKFSAIDTKIIILEIDPGSGAGAHLVSHLDLGFFSHRVMFFVRNELLAPNYPTLDTKILVLRSIVTEIGMHLLLTAILAAILNSKH